MQKSEVHILNSILRSPLNLSFFISLPLPLPLSSSCSSSSSLLYTHIFYSSLDSSNLSPHIFLTKLRINNAVECGIVRTYLNMSNNSTSVSTTSKPSPLGQQQHTSAQLIDIYAAVAPLTASWPQLHSSAFWVVRFVPRTRVIGGYKDRG